MHIYKANRNKYLKDVEYANGVLRELFEEHFGGRILGRITFNPQSMFGEDMFSVHKILVPIDGKKCSEYLHHVTLTYLIEVLKELINELENQLQGKSFFMRREVGFNIGMETYDEESKKMVSSDNNGQMVVRVFAFTGNLQKKK